VNHYYFYIDDDNFGPLFIKVDGFHNRDLRVLVVNLLGVSSEEYTTSQMTYDLRRLRLKGLIFRPPKTHRYFLTPHGWKIARLFSRLESRVFRPALAMFTSNDAVLPFPLRASLNRVDAQLDKLIYQASFASGTSGRRLVIARRPSMTLSVLLVNLGRHFHGRWRKRS
jgi:hypothetical protein